MAKKTLRIESLDGRLCMAASVGWDGAGQGSAALTYYVGAIPSAFGVDQATAKAAIQTALATWAKVADIVFTEIQTAGRPNSIDFTFRSIDGRNGTLAQAYFPGDVNRGSIAGDVQFDTLESWEVGNARGGAAVDLIWVAVHEIGHALGLDHAPGAGVVMAASVSAGQSFSALAAADINAIQRLYAPSRGGGSVAAPGTTTISTTPATPTSPRTPPTDPGSTNIPQPGPFNPAAPRYRYFGGRQFWGFTSPWRYSANWGQYGSVAREADETPPSRVQWGWNNGARLAHRSHIHWPAD